MSKTYIQADIPPKPVPCKDLRFDSQYDGEVSLDALITHLRAHSVRTDGPFTLRSGKTSSWYIDARQTTFDGFGAALAGAAVLDVLSDEVEAVGGMTMGADPISVATAVLASQSGRPLRAFSIRKEEKDHGVGGRLVGPVTAGTNVAIIEDTTTTGGAPIAAAETARAEGLNIIQAISVVDRSRGAAGAKFEAMDIPYVALVKPADLGVGD
ncbi:MAG: orotate phosphoribosyltransferase [Acidimicrobiia bacterium]|nr:orotate phosphoribosyltransferase [Acidimicrobiia bacterium]